MNLAKEIKKTSVNTPIIKAILVGDRAYSENFDWDSSNEVFDKFISETLDCAASDNFKAIISTSAIHLNVGCGFEKNQGLTLGQLAKNGILLLLNSLKEIFPHPSL